MLVTDVQLAIVAEGRAPADERAGCRSWRRIKGFAKEGMHEALADIPRGGEVLPQERDDDLGGGRPLLGFDAGLLNDLAPKGDLLPDLIEELLRRAARGCGSVIAQVLDCVFAHQQSAHVRV